MNGEHIASGGLDRSIRIWCRSTGDCEAAIFDCEGYPLGLALSADSLLCGESTSFDAPTLGVAQGEASKAAAAATGASRARLWSMRLLLLSEGGAEPLCAYAEHTGAICSVGLGESIAVSAGFSDLTARAWPLGRSGQPPSLAVMTHPAAVCSVSVNYASTLVATGCADGNVRLWNPHFTSRACVRILRHSGDGGTVSCVRLNSGMLLSGGEDGHVKLWSLATDAGEADATEVTTLKGEIGVPVQGLAFSSLAGFIAVAAGDQLVVWRPKLPMLAPSRRPSLALSTPSSSFKKARPVGSSKWPAQV